MKKLWIVLLAAGIGIAGCSKKDDTPSTNTNTNTNNNNNNVEKKPSACFSPPNTLEVGVEAAFINCSPNSANLTFDYDFGDGTTHGHQASSKHTYTKSGNYMVKLTVQNMNGVLTDIDSQEVHVGQRYLSKIVINSIDFINPSTSKHWDTDASGPGNDTVGPDLFIGASPSDSDFQPNYFYPSNSIMQNVTSIPAAGLEFTVPSGKYILLTNKSWDFSILDWQYPASGSGGSHRFLRTLKANPITDFSANIGSKVLTDGKYKVTVYWEVK